MRHLALLIWWYTSQDFLASTRLCLAGHVIRSNLPYLSPSKPGMNFYLICQMTSAHLTSNSMLCDNTLLCPRRLFSSPISSWLCSPQPMEATKLSLFQPPGVYKEPEMGQNYSVSPLLLPRQHLSKTCLHLHLSPCFWMFHAQTWRACSCVALPCPPRGPQLFHSQVNLTSKIVLAKCDFWLSLRGHFTSQERACKCTFDLHWEVTSPLKNVLASALVTFTHKSLRCDFHPIREGLPLWCWFLLWHSHPALESLILPSGATHPAVQEAHCGLGFARGAVSAQILP